VSEATDQMRPGSSPLEELAAALGETVTWLRRETKPAAWSAVALSTLDALNRRGAQRVSDLVALEHISQPGMTGLIGRLGEAGLVARRPDPSDKRAALVSVTDAGRRYLADVRRARTEVLTRHLATLPPEQQHALLRALPALTALTASAGPSTPAAATPES
jgi:DNA-binding MarR family transcriptional regulator